MSEENNRAQNNITTYNRNSEENRDSNTDRKDMINKTQKVDIDIDINNITNYVYGFFLNIKDDRDIKNQNHDIIPIDENEDKKRKNTFLKYFIFGIVFSVIVLVTLILLWLFVFKKKKLEKMKKIIRKKN
jgi:hypothetical protein